MTAGRAATAKGPQMKKLTHELSYPGATVDQVAAMLGDREFREAVCEAQRVLRHTVAISHAGETKVVEMQQVQATSGIPSFAKRLVGDETEILTKEIWSSTTEAIIDINIPGKPGEMTGTIILVETAAAVVETVDLAISVAIPLVGGKIEAVLLDLMTKALKKEHQVGREWLAR